MEEKTFGYKQFNPVAYKATTGAVSKTISLFKKLRAICNPDQYDIDIICYDGNHELFFLEVEQRAYFSETKFPFETVHIPFRKKKFFIKNSIPCFYLVYSEDLTQILIINSKEVVDCEIVTIDTRSSIQERFYDIPIEKFEQIQPWLLEDYLLNKINGGTK